MCVTEVNLTIPFAPLSVLVGIPLTEYAVTTLLTFSSGGDDATRTASLVPVESCKVTIDDTGTEGVKEREVGVWGRRETSRSIWNRE